MLEYEYLGLFRLADGREEVLDLEERGWADKTRISATVRFTLLPKPATDKPIVAINVPSGGKVVFKTRVFGTAGIAGSGSGPLFRCYAAGWKMGNLENLAWVLPTGDVELTTNDDVYFGDLLLKRLKQG